MKNSVIAEAYWSVNKIPITCSNQRNISDDVNRNWKEILEIYLGMVAIKKKVGI